MVLDVVETARIFVETPEWFDKMEAWGEGYAELTKELLLSAINKGTGPNQIASTMRQHAENIPLSAAENLTRTLQLTSYREASLTMEAINDDFIIGKIRIANLDNKTCLTCISLHGTKLQPGERVDDHYRGRCTEFYQVPGGPEFPSVMQSDSLPGDRNFVPFEKGEDWFANLPPERQAQQASFLNTPAKFNAYNDGVPLSDFVGVHTDDVFGRQTIEQSLKGALGDDADQYYVNQPKPPDEPSGDFDDLTKAEQNALFNEFNDAIFDDLPEEQAQALADYTAGGYVGVNDGLRDDDIDEKIQEQIELIDSAIQNTPNLPSDTKLYRGLTSEAYNDAFNNGDLVVGDVIIEDGFMSTSIGQETPWLFTSKKNNGVFYEILAPKGTTGIYVEPVTTQEGELEWLLPKGTNLKIVSIDTSNPNTVIVVMEIEE